MAATAAADQVEAVVAGGVEVVAAIGE